MAAEWDNLIPDLPSKNSSNLNDSHDRKHQPSNQISKTRKKKAYTSPGEQNLLSEDQDVTEYVMEYTDIFEASTKQKLEFVDIQEGDAISETSDDEIVAHSSEAKMYEHTEDLADSDGSEDLSRLPPDDTGVATYGVDVDLQINNGIIDEDKEFNEAYVRDKEDNIMDNVGHSHDKEANYSNLVKLEETEMNLEQVGVEKQVDVLETKSTNEEVVKEKEMIKQRGTKKTMEVESEKLSDEESSGEEVKVLPEDDYSDETTETDKLLQDNSKEVDLEQKKTRSKMVSSNTQPHETEPLLNSSLVTSSQTPSPGAEDLLQHRKQLTPKGYPGKAVKSIAIGTDDDYPSNGLIKEPHSRATPEDKGKRSTSKTPFRQGMKNGVKTPGKNSTHTPRSSRQSPASIANYSSDATFFKSRLPQTSKRHPKRHVWLVRDSEIHRLIAEKAVILRRYKEDGKMGRVKSKGFPNYSEVDVLGLPSVGYSGRTKDDSHRSSVPYSRHPSSRLSRSGYRGGSSSEDEDERTNRMGNKGAKSGTFAVGLAARREKSEISQSSTQQEPVDQDDGCELCAAEAREKEKHEKKLQELEAAAKAGPHHPRNLMLGIVYSAKFLGCTNLMSPPAPNKAIRLRQAQEAIGRIKVPEGEEQPSSDVDLFISTERIKIVSSENKQPLSDHHLKTISFIADIGDIIVVMARLSSDGDENKTWSGKMPDFSGIEKQEQKTTKVICHVLETSEAQTIAKTVGQAFNIAYHEFLKANRLNLGEIEELEYNGILEQQKILGEELSLLADETKAKEVVIHKKYGECLLLMIVESGWGSMIPTVVIAHMDNKGPAAKSGQLNVGNQILAVNGQSLVGLPLLECQNIIKAQKYVDRVAFKVVSCPPTVEISINRPDTKYQLGFSVQNGMICSLMRGGIAERGGVRVGHKIIEMNGESVVAASHHHIVDILQSTIGELRMKTMPILLYKLLVGLELPQYL